MVWACCAPAGGQMPTPEQRIEALENDLKMLKQQVETANFFKVAVHQQGLVPGELIAGRIRGIAPPGQAGMVADFTASVAGNSPRVAASDGSHVRAEMGNLAAVGNSPAQWGFRASD